MERLRKSQLSFGVNNFIQNAHKVFYNIFLRACVSNTTLKKHLLVRSWHHIFCHNTIKNAITFFLIRNPLLTKKKENYNFAHKIVEKSGKSWVLLISLMHLVTVLTDGIVGHSFICKRLPRSILIIYLIATKYNYR